MDVCVLSTAAASLSSTATIVIVNGIRSGIDDGIRARSFLLESEDAVARFLFFSRPQQVILSRE